MKKCPYCAEEIQDAAIKCRYCGEFLDGAVRVPPPAAPTPPADGLKWYFRTAFIVLALASVGPFALPLIWWHPKLSAAGKVVLTVLILALTYVMCVVTGRLAQNILTMYKQLQAF